MVIETTPLCGNTIVARQTVEELNLAMIRHVRSCTACRDIIINIWLVNRGFK